MAVPDADAQIYTRKNEHGVIEATNVPAERGYQLTYPGKGTLIHSAAWRLRPNYNGEYDHHIAAAAATHNVSTQLVRAVIQVESDFDSLARSSKGAQGLMQLMPDTARQLGVSNAFDPRQNIFAGVRYLRILLDMFQGDVALATAAYNAGRIERAALRRHPSLQGDAQLRGQDPVPALGPGAPMVTAASAPDDVVRSRRQPVRHQGARGDRDGRGGQADGQADARAAQDLLPLEGRVRRDPRRPGTARGGRRLLDDPRSRLARLSAAGAMG